MEERLRIGGFEGYCCAAAVRVCFQCVYADAGGWGGSLPPAPVSCSGGKRSALTAGHRQHLRLLFTRLQAAVVCSNPLFVHLIYMFNPVRVLLS